MLNMKLGLVKLYAGDFNDMFQEIQPDGSVIITLSKRGEAESYRFRVRDLYGENEEVLEHEIIMPGVNSLVTERMAQAKKQLGGD